MHQKRERKMNDGVRKRGGEKRREKQDKKRMKIRNERRRENGKVQREREDKETVIDKNRCKNKTSNQSYQTRQCDDRHHTETAIIRFMTRVNVYDLVIKRIIPVKNIPRRLFWISSIIFSAFFNGHLVTSVAGSIFLFTTSISGQKDYFYFEF